MTDIDFGTAAATGVPVHAAVDARPMNVGDRTGYDTRQHLEHATQQARDRSFSELLIVDADAHHYESESWPDIVKYIEDPILRHRAEASSRPMLERSQVDQNRAGRLFASSRRRLEEVPDGLPRDVTLIQREMEAIG